MIVCGGGHGRVKAMYDTLRPRQKVKEAGPEHAGQRHGSRRGPECRRQVLRARTTLPRPANWPTSGSSRRAQQIARRASPRKVSFEDFQQRLAEGRLGQDEDVATLNLIIRADVRGSIEAILKELGKFEHPEVKIKVLQASVGGITVADVTLADASDAVDRRLQRHSRRSGPRPGRRAAASKSAATTSSTS